MLQQQAAPADPHTEKKNPKEAAAGKRTDGRTNGKTGPTFSKSQSQKTLTHGGHNFRRLFLREKPVSADFFPLVFFFLRWRPPATATTAMRF